MTCLLIDEKQHVKKFKFVEMADIYMTKHKGVYFLIEIHQKFLGVSIIESKNGEITKIKDMVIKRYSC